MASRNQVLLTFAGDSTDLDRTVGSVGGKLDQFGDKADASGGRLAGLSTKLTTAGASMRQFGRRATLVATVPIVAAFGAAQQASSNLAEAQNATNVVFGQGIDVINRAAETSAEKMGLSERAFREAVTPMGAMLQNLGFSQQEAGDSSVMLAERAADMASVFNTDVSQALDAINAGLRGESDPLEQFGVGLSAAAVNAKAMEMGLAGTESELTDNQKAQARLALLMEQTDGIAGDFANTSDEAANSQRILKAEAEDAAAAFGNNLEPIMNKVLGVAGGLLDKFNNLSPGMQNVIMYVGLAVAALGPLVSVIGTLSTVMGFLAANPIVLVIAAIAALVIGLIWAYNNVEWFRDLVDGAFTLIKDVISGVFGWVSDNWPLLLGILTGPIGIAVLVIVKHWDTIKEKAGQAFDWIKDKVTGAKDWIVARFDDVVSFITGLPSRISEAASGMWDGIKDSFKSVINTIIGWWNGLSLTLPTISLPSVDLGPLGSLGGGSVGGQTFTVPQIPYLHDGGVVPGAPGTDVLSILEAGETVTPAGVTPGGDVYNIHIAGSILSERDVIKLIRDEFKRGGFR